jgi:hypothetical protein
MALSKSASQSAWSVGERTVTVPVLPEEREIKLKTLQRRYAHVIVELTEVDGDEIELFQVRSGWLFLDSENKDLWCFYPNCVNSGKYLTRYSVPEFTDISANFTSYKCKRWPGVEDCYNGKLIHVIVNRLLR